MKEASYWEIKFKFKYPNNPGEEIRVTGNTDSLGNWNYDLAPKLFYDSKKDCWKTRAYIKVPDSFDLEYKYILYKDNKFEKLEEIDTNRKISLPEREKLIFTDEQNNTDTKVIKYLAKAKKKISTGFSGKSVKSHLKSALRTPKMKKIASAKKSLAYSDSNNKLDSKNDNQEKVDDNKDNGDESDDEERKNLEKRESLDDFQELNYTSKDEDEDDNINTKLSITDSVKDSEISDDKDEIIMISTYIPFNPIRNKDGTFDFILTNEAIYHTLYRVIESKKNIKWFGNLKYLKKLKEEDKKEITKKLEERNIFVLDIEESIYHKVLRLFEEILEPLFHYNTLKSSIMEDFNLLSDHWKAYKEYNDCVCKQISKHLTKSTLIYIHDINYLLLPNLLYAFNKHNNEILQNLAIGLFIHSPFPSFDVFKRIPIREEILRSLMKCRVIGFHTFDCSRNFLKSAKRLLSTNYVSTNSGDLAVNYSDYTSLIRVKNISPEIDLLKEDIQKEEFKKHYNEIKEKYGNKKNIFVSVDHMQFLLSIKNKLEGYRAFLRDLKEKARKNVFLLYIRYFDKKEDQNIDYHIENNRQKMINKIDELVLEIKKEFGDDVIEFYKGKITYIHRLALFSASNCFVRSSKQESYSLGLYEFLITKKLLNQKGAVAYMISELSGINTSLGATIKINPFDMNSLKKGFLEASQLLSETSSHYLMSLEKDYTHAMKSSCKDWFFSFLQDVKNTKLSDENTFYIGADEGLNFKLLKINPNFKKLNLKQISSDYEKAHKRLLFFDYEGTLPSAYQNKSFVSKGSPPSTDILNLLKGLTADKRNKVFIVAGKGPEQLKEWFGGVKNIGLAAEHGFMYWENRHGLDKWKKIIKKYDNEWIRSCSDIIFPYLERCEGSFVDVKESSIVWQYTDCDQELGKQFASAMTSELNNLVNKYNLKIVNGKGFMEIIAVGVNKGYFVGYKIKEYIKKKKNLDFILCIGDDTSDEKMFHYLKMKKDEIRKFCKKAKIYGITVGKKPSKANFYVEKIKNVQEMINAFVKASNKLSSSISTLNIRASALNTKYRIENNEEEEVEDDDNEEGRKSLGKK
jgi:trehalose 6-phosphate synthase/phosphatase